MLVLRAPGTVAPMKYRSGREPGARQTGDFIASIATGRLLAIASGKLRFRREHARRTIYSLTEPVLQFSASSFLLAEYPL